MKLPAPMLALPERPQASEVTRVERATCERSPVLFATTTRSPESAPAVPPSAESRVAPVTESVEEIAVLPLTVSGMLKTA